MPLSYAAILGGTLTLIGTSTNLVVSSVVENTYEHFIDCSSEIDEFGKDLGENREALQQLHQRKAELLGHLQITNEEAGLTQAQLEQLEQRCS